jgi:hypothetical protein
MNRSFDESTLSTFMDGELDAAGMQEVDEFLRQDAGAREFVLSAVRAVAFFKASAIATLHERMPERLLDSFKPAAAASGRSGSGGRLQRWAAAAVLVALFGLAAGILGRLWMPRAGDSVPLASLVERYGLLVDAALENNLSGTPREWRQPGEPAFVTVTPVRTYRDPGQQRYYREYRLKVSSGKDIREVGGLAFRTDEGRWKTTAVFF